MSTSHDLDLAGARQRLEAAFAIYPARHPVEGCPCCVTPEDQAALEAGHLGRFAFKALSTWGDVEDFKHFLPRLLDHDLEQALGKLDYAGWREWPQTEQRAIEGYLAALWEDRLAEADAYPPAADLLLALVELGIDLLPHLARWRMSTGGAAAAQLVALINDHSGTIYRMANTPRSAASQTLLDWLLEPATAEALEASFFAADGPDAAEISLAVEHLALLAQICR